MKIKFFVFLFFVGIVLNGCAKKSPTIVGNKAPNFSLLDAIGKKYSLSDFRGNKVALYFFPKAGTPYCTKQACSLRDNFSMLKKKGIVVIGISNDSPEKLKSFAASHHLPFLLLSDEKQDVIKAYGVKGLFFNKRRTFLINEQGFISGIITNIDVTHHAQQISDSFTIIEK